MRILQIELIFCLTRGVNHRYTIVNYFHILKSEIKYKIKIILKLYQNFILCLYFLEILLYAFIHILYTYILLLLEFLGRGKITYFKNEYDKVGQIYY